MHENYNKELKYVANNKLIFSWRMTYVNVTCLDVQNFLGCLCLDMKEMHGKSGNDFETQKKSFNHRPPWGSNPRPQG